MSHARRQWFILSANERDADDMSKNSAEDIVRRATAAFNSGQPDEARRLCEQGLARQPGDPMLNHLLAAVLFSKGEIQSARIHLETSLAKRPANAAAQLLAARIARTTRNFDDALSHLDRAIAIAPQREAFLEKARTLDQAGLRLAAREAWRAILEVIPQSMEAAARLGRLAWEDGDHASALALLERAVASDPPHPSGSISASSARICVTMAEPPPPTARRST
jgi:tetratricopeptide (TPR) repeat protein